MHKRQSLYKVLAESDTKTKNTIHNTNYIHIITLASLHKHTQSYTTQRKHKIINQITSEVRHKCLYNERRKDGISSC